MISTKTATAIFIILNYCSSKLYNNNFLMLINNFIKYTFLNAEKTISNQKMCDKGPKLVII